MSLSPASAAILAGSALGIVYALGVCVQALLAQRWPSVRGEIASTRAVHRMDADGSADYPYVAYRYEVNGRPYRNDRVRFGPQVIPSSVVPALDPEPRTSAVAESLQRDFPRGRPVQVYYNPRHPASSVLYRTPNASVWVILLTAALFGWAALRG